MSSPINWMYEHVWVMIGFTGQVVFMSRMMVQWIAAERKQDAVIPVAFWWLSLAGGVISLSYAVHKQDPVFMVAQGLGTFVYLRNLMLIHKGRPKGDGARATCRGPHQGRAVVTGGRPPVERG